MHDWSDSTCLEILKHLRAAAGTETELIIIENLMEYACPDTTINKNVPGMSSENIAPAPLLPNYGHANVFPYLGDLQVSLRENIVISQSLIFCQMIGSLNGAERTAAQFSALLHKAGWKMTRIYRAPVGHHKIVASILWNMNYVAGQSAS